MNPRAKTTRSRVAQRDDMLLELGTEELPAAYLGPMLEQWQQEAERLLRDAHLECASVETFGTPRRVLLCVKQLARVQRNPPEEIRGPSAQAAFGGDGKPTNALTGFLRARGGTLSQINTVSTTKGKYVYLCKPSRTAPTATVLPELLGQLIGRIRVPKTMRWDDSPLRFARPIRWLVALYGDTTLKVRIGRLVSGNATRVGGPKRPRIIRVSNPVQHAAILRRHGIVWAQDARRQRIQQLVTRCAAQRRGRPAHAAIAHGLLDEVTYLVECPTPLVGRFDPTYLTLPPEVLLASMAKHQRVFAIEDRRGKLLPYFVAILEGTPRKLATVRRVHEHILNARLADSLLFWEQDCETPLATLVAKTSGITFHERLGSMADKTQRMHQLSAVLEDAWQLSREQRAHLRRACELAKADLASTLVKEFPTLQGVMGRYYVRHANEPEAVAAAIAEHYLPLAGRAPKTMIGQALAILDKYDTLASYFAIGIEPTGDQDPFGLRRAAQGIVEVAWAAQKPLPFYKLRDACARMAPFSEGHADPGKHIQRVGERIRTYLFERLYTFAWPKPAPSRDLIDAVLASAGNDDLVDVMDRIVSLRRLDGQQTLLRAAKVVERTHNILKAATQQPTEVDPARFQDPLEHALWERYTQQHDAMARLIAAKEYTQATAGYGDAFFEPLHEFFAKVLVNVPDQAVQRNRLALMRVIKTLYTDRIADLSKLAILQREERGG